MMQRSMSNVFCKKKSWNQIWKLRVIGLENIV